MLRTGTSLVAAALAATVLLAGCANSGAVTGAGTPKGALSGTPAPTSTPTPSTAARDDIADDAVEDTDAGRPQAFAACQLIHERDGIPIPTLTEAAVHANAAAEINPRWGDLADAIVGMRDYSARHEGVADLPRDESLQFAADSEAMEKLCYDLLGTTVFTP